ncbi:hypothetical protein BDV38DRAFT_66553 [Aspergillus pseudotamarii]|uniref:Uncharacterized protein n=1 Tax=Aspergillus pseudotamarii TaxID=132259 RepID=A0A5N6TAT1_ASPPS|nr:uncharacterized protein BDV38DRAFT_66553 [Aspergillus pseudotamarii]KAE8143377.1 hypothetical protein BDV38DRAFT_66553 [Aspergillus pseudotamarii]
MDTTLTTYNPFWLHESCSLSCRGLIGVACELTNGNPSKSSRLSDKVTAWIISIALSLYSSLIIRSNRSYTSPRSRQGSSLERRMITGPSSNLLLESKSHKQCFISPSPSPSGGSQ